MRVAIPLGLYAFTALSVSALALPSQDLANSAADPSLASLRYSRRDDVSQRKQLVACINKDMEKANADFKLTDEEVVKLESIVDREILKEPLKTHSADEQARALKEIEEAAKKDLPRVPTETIDKMMDKLKELGMHCAREMGS